MQRLACHDAVNITFADESMCALRSRTQDIRHWTAEKHDDLVPRLRALGTEAHVSALCDEESPIEAGSHDLVREAPFRAEIVFSIVDLERRNESISSNAAFRPKEMSVQGLRQGVMILDPAATYL